MIMEAEKRLLMIDNSEKKFQFGMGELCKLKRYIREIGEITDLYFNSQIEYANLIKGKDNFGEKLKAYHERLLDSDVDYDLSKLNPMIGELG